MGKRLRTITEEGQVEVIEKCFLSFIAREHIKRDKAEKTYDIYNLGNLKTTSSVICKLCQMHDISVTNKIGCRRIKISDTYIK